MALMETPAAAILWAQFRTILNFYRKPQMGGYWVGTIVMIIWYLMLAAGGVGLALLLGKVKPSEFPSFELVLTYGFLVAFLYWQVVPVFLASTGMSLDTRKLMVYPIPEGQLFFIEVLLRLSTGVEVLLLLTGAFVGLLRNPEIPLWAPFTILIFIIFNLYLSAGIKDLVARIMERKGIREAAVLGLVILMVSPQMIAFMGVPPAVRKALVDFNQSLFPWGVAAGLAMGRKLALNIPLSLAYLAAAIWFGRWQFHRSLHFDVDSVRAQSGHGGTTSGAAWTRWLFHWPRYLFSDPLAALVEKELQSLARSSRFRLVFFMGFTFGLVVWLPLAFGRGGFSSQGPIESNFLTWISVYSVMMLGEVALFNSLGFDRAAAQFYWIAPVKIRTVLLAKNITASVFIFLELTIITLVCLTLRLPVGGWKIAEAFAVTSVLAIFFTGLGNIGTIYYPRSADPQNSWRARGGGKFQLWMLLAYPVLGTPIALAYLARYAFDSQFGFFGVLLLTLILSMVFYWIAMGTAEEGAAERREQILTALSESGGPIGS
jgi:ABC-2 type transport system permease protein